MQSFIPTLKPQTLKSWRMITPLLALLLVLAVACGEAAAPTSPPPAAQATEAPQAAAQPTEAPQAAAQPTAVPATAAPPKEVKVNPGKLTIMVGFLGNERFDFAFQSGGGGSTDNYSRILHGWLISDTPDKRMVPGIASRWGFSADGLTWTFTIREGVKWHDGSDLTPEDVLWSLQHQFGPQALDHVSSSTSIRISRVMDRIELSEPDVVSLTTKQPFLSLAIALSETSNGSTSLMPKRAKLHDTEQEAAYDRKPIGAGFMKLVGHTPAEVMRFERFDDFYYQPDNGFPEDKRVKFQSLDLFVVKEEATRVAALRSGDVDIAPASLASKKQVEAGGGRLVFGAEGVWVDVLLLGCFDPQYPCHDKRVRQALDFAIDKELIRDRLFGGPDVFQVKGWNVVTPSTIGYTPALDPSPFDPDKARQLLVDAGYPGGEGFGKLIVNTRVSTALPLQVEMVQLAAEFWKRELGLDVEVRVLDGVGLGQRARALELNGQIIWRDNETRTDARRNVSAYFGDPEGYRHLHEDPELFQLVQETIQILDEDKQVEALQKMYLRTRNEGYKIGIGYANIPWAVRPRVLTWQPYRLSIWPSGLHTVTLE